MTSAARRAATRIISTLTATTVAAVVVDMRRAPVPTALAGAYPLATELPAVASMAALPPLRVALPSRKAAPAAVAGTVAGVEAPPLGALEAGAAARAPAT